MLHRNFLSTDFFGVIAETIPHHLTFLNLYVYTPELRQKRSAVTSPAFRSIHFRSPLSSIFILQSEIIRLILKPIKAVSLSSFDIIT